MAIKVQAPWDYTVRSGSPESGGVLHDDAVLNVHKIDIDLVDQGVALLTLVVGDVIYGAGSGWEIVGGPVDQTTFVEFTVTPLEYGLKGISEWTMGTEDIAAAIQGVTGQYRRMNVRGRGPQKRASRLSKRKVFNA